MSASDKRIGRPNRTEDVRTGSAHWYVSYNTADRALYGGNTTALVIGQYEVVLILNGDHRKQLQEAADVDDLSTTRLERCIEYVKSRRSMLNERGSCILSPEP